MPTVFAVDSGRCDKKTNIVAEMAEDGRIKVSITSNCSQVKRYAEKFTEVHVKEITKSILTNPIYITASSCVGPECPVPCGVVTATWTEAGMVSKNILKKYPIQCIEFKQ